MFQSTDRQRFQSKQIDYVVVEPDDSETAEMEMGFTRPLGKVVPRLELLGYTLDTARKHYATAVASCLDERDALEEHGHEETNDLMTFEEFIDFIKSENLQSLNSKFFFGSDDDNDVKAMGRFANDSRKHRLPHFSLYDRHYWSERSYFGSLGAIPITVCGGCER